MELHVSQMMYELPYTPTKKNTTNYARCVK